jgi:hypothetical protein
MKVNGFCYEIHFHNRLPLQRYVRFVLLDIIFVAFYPLLSHGINLFTKIMLPILKLDTNHGFHELFLKYSAIILVLTPFSYRYSRHCDLSITFNSIKS